MEFFRKEIVEARLDFPEELIEWPLRAILWMDLKIVGRRRSLQGGERDPGGKAKSSGEERQRGTLRILGEEFAAGKIEWTRMRCGPAQENAPWFSRSEENLASRSRSVKKGGNGSLRFTQSAQAGRRLW